MKKIILVGSNESKIGKTTLAMHIISSLMNLGYKVQSIDADNTTLSLTDYIIKRQNANIAVPFHVVAKNYHDFNNCISSYPEEYDFIVVDTPSLSHYAETAYFYSHADLLVTPISTDKIDDLDISCIETQKKSYPQIIWEQKLIKAQNTKHAINWIVIPNKLNHKVKNNKFEECKQRFGCKVIYGFTKSSIFSELTSKGVTLVELFNTDIQPNIEHIIARQELQGIINFLFIQN